MNEIVINTDSDSNLDLVDSEYESIVNDENHENYYLNLRCFPSGEFEAVLKVVRPLRHEQIAASMAGATLAPVLAENGLTRSDLYPRFTHGPKEEPVEPSETQKARNLARNVHRSKQNIRWLCKSFGADRLFTLTYRENQTDREQTRADFKKFLRLVRSGWRGQAGVPDWKYVAVLEKQERGAFHIHCAVKGWQRINFLRAAWYKALGCTGNETGENTPGAVNVTNPDKSRWGHTGRQWKVQKLSGYLTKYLSKTFEDSSAEKRRYWHCRQIIQPVKQRFWVSGSEIIQAIKSTINLLDFHVGIKPNFNHWLSTSLDSYWVSGQGEPLGQGGSCA